MVVGGDRHADRDDDGPVSRDARDRTMYDGQIFDLGSLFCRLIGRFSAPFKFSVSAVSCVVLDNIKTLAHGGRTYRSPPRRNNVLLVVCVCVCVCVCDR